MWYILNYLHVDTDKYLNNDLLGKWVKSVKQMSLDENAGWLSMIENALIPQLLPYITILFGISYVLAFFSNEPLCKDYYFKSFNEW